ncbi:MAG TPA: response regulator, partial [Candidatus Saccharimonadia bacterium]|nr:response regulator [Candidatus Saccharimonadia bacterium]
MSGSSDQIRLLLVEDVPQVAQYVRGLLNAQSHIKLLDVVSDGRKVPEFVREGHPDIVMIDALLQGKVRGLNLAAGLRQEGLATPIVIVTVPQNPIARDPDKGIDAVLAMPFSGFELINLLQSIMAQAQAEKPEGRSRVFSVFAPKGGVGKTTIAFNLAVALAQTGDTRTALVDGSLQFGDMRSLLRVPADAPSILDLPTDRISESDLSDVLWRDPSGIDILLAPPRVEMHEMLSVRDVDKILSILRRVYPVVVVDTT